MRSPEVQFNARPCGEEESEKDVEGLRNRINEGSAFSTPERRISYFTTPDGSSPGDHFRSFEVDTQEESPNPSNATNAEILGSHQEAMQMAESLSAHRKELVEAHERVHYLGQRNRKLAYVVLRMV